MVALKLIWKGSGHRGKLPSRTDGQLELSLSGGIAFQSPPLMAIVKSSLGYGAAPDRDASDARQSDVIMFHRQVQLELVDLFPNSGSEIIQFVPRDRHPALDRHFPSLAFRDRKLRRVAGVLARRGKLKLGDVVGLSEGEVLEACNDDHETLQRLKQLLGEFGLQLNSKVPLWRQSTG